MGHEHDHGGGLTAASAQRGRLMIVLIVTAAILVAEILGGLAAHSLVLIADAGHMAADAAGIGLSLLAISLAARPSSEERTFGYERAEILAALFNAIVLLAIGVFILVEAAFRLAHPGTATPWLMAVFGLVALVGNGASLGLLRHGQGESLNVRGAFLEVLSDFLGAFAILAAAAVIATTHFQRADALASILIGALILPRTVKLVRDAFDVLVEATPRDVDLAEVRSHIKGAAGVLDVHDLHAWTITSGNRVLSAHVVISDEAWADGGGDRVLDELCECLSGHFDVQHCTFQLENSSHRDHERSAHP
jgi:cobalt-zinc-cadmium efflux system protein